MFVTPLYTIILNGDVRNGFIDIDTNYISSSLNTNSEQTMYIVGVIVIVLLFIWLYKQPKTTTVTVGARDWNVLDRPDSAEVATLLSKAHQRMITLMATLGDKYHIDLTEEEIAADPVGHANAVNAPGDAYNIVDNLLNNYNPDVFYENAPGTDGTSWTINKGDRMHLCLRSLSGAPVDLNTFMFVLIHESAHIANYNGYGHEEDFWAVFKFLLREAVKLNLYTRVDYAVSPINYCGLVIEYQPLDDDSLPTIG